MYFAPRCQDCGISWFCLWGRVTLETRVLQPTVQYKYKTVQYKYKTVEYKYTRAGARYLVGNRLRGGPGAQPTMGRRANGIRPDGQIFGLFWRNFGEMKHSFGIPFSAISCNQFYWHLGTYLRNLLKPTENV